MRTVFLVKILTTAGAAFLTRDAKERLISAWEDGTRFCASAVPANNMINRPAAKKAHAVDLNGVNLIVLS